MKTKRLKSFAVGVALASSVACSDSTSALTEECFNEYNLREIETQSQLESSGIVSYASFPEAKPEEEKRMLGGIYSDQRCPICKGRFRDNRKNGLQCPKHPDQWATHDFKLIYPTGKREGVHDALPPLVSGIRSQYLIYQEDGWDPQMNAPVIAIGTFPILLLTMHMFPIFSSLVTIPISQRFPTCISNASRMSSTRLFLSGSTMTAL